MKKIVDDLQYLLSLFNHKVTFVVYSLPGEKTFNYIIDDNASPIISNKKFVISTWNGNKIYIHDRASFIDLNNVTTNTIDHTTTQYSETSWHDYKDAIDHVTKLLKSTQGKVVVSRIKLLIDSRLEYKLISKAILSMFQANGDAFCAAYYTPKTGAWCVCSPELLLKINKHTGLLHTIALAGTRKGNSVGDWDEKNIREHSYVVKYIANTLKSLGIAPQVEPAKTMVTGDIQHIMTCISGLLNPANNSIEEIVDELHPTPAICGYPISWSRNIINVVERHERECYGGYIALDDDDIFIAHVNLRCFAFSPGVCRFWGGGGIMADSVPEIEWKETELKINASLSFLQMFLP